MTVAVDIKTGAVVGQFIACATVEGIESYRLLSAEGYRYVPRTSVRLEKV